MNKGMKNSFEKIRWVTLVVIFFTGFSGLVYEITWHRFLSNLVGSQAKAAALILAVFLGGLCTGYALFGWFSKNRSQRFLVRVCGFTEIGIGLWAILFTLLYHFFWKLFGILDPLSSWSVFIDILVCVLLIGFPTTLMGGTLPLLTQGLSKDLKDASSLHARVYAVNTSGAFLGCLVAGFILLPLLGLQKILMIMGILNLVGGFILVRISLGLSNEIIAIRSIESKGQSKRIWQSRIFRDCMIAFLAGFYSISLQTVFMRIIGLTLGSSEYSFSMVVAVYILMLALGAWRLSGKRSEKSSLWINQTVILIGILAVYATIPLWSYWFHLIRIQLTSLETAFFIFHAMIFLLLTLLLLLPIGAMGSTMPLLFTDSKSRMGNLGEDVGKLYGWNTLGCVAGALLGGHLFLYFWNLDQIMRFCMVAIGVTIALTIPLVFPKVPQWIRRSFLTRSRLLSTSLVFLIIGAIFLPDWNKQFLGIGLFRVRKAINASLKGFKAVHKAVAKNQIVRAYRDGPNTTVSIVEDPVPDDGREKVIALFVNGKSDGQTGGDDRITMRLTAHLPALLQTSSNKRAAVVGFGTGITLGTLSLYDQIERIDCIEISPVVRDFAPWFDFANHSISKSPKLHWKVGDAFRVLGSDQGKYGLIISQPSNPWVTGVERLYSQEFFNLVVNRLDEGGIYAQWVQLYSISEKTIDLMLNTFSSVFSHIRLFKLNNDLIILGSLTPLEVKSLDHFFHNFFEDPIRKDFESINYFYPEEVLALERTIPTKLFWENRVHSLLVPKLAFWAGRDFFTGPTGLVHSKLEKNHAKPWFHSKYQKSLLNIWVNNFQANPIASMKNYARFTCQKKDLQFFPHWEGSPVPCPQVLMGLAMAGEITTPEANLKDSDWRLLNVLKQKKEDPLSIEEVLGALGLFLRFDSVFLPLDESFLPRIAKPCLENRGQQAIQCRLVLIEVLAFKNAANESRTQFDSLISDEGKEIPDRVKKLFEKKVREAEKRVHSFKENQAYFSRNSLN